MALLFALKIVMWSYMVLDGIRRQLAWCIHRSREARLYRHVGLWLDGIHRSPPGVSHPAGGGRTPGRLSPMKFRPYRRSGSMRWGNEREELFLDSKSGAFEERRFRLRSVAAIERLYLVALKTILYATTQSMTVQIAFLARLRSICIGNAALAISLIGLRWL